MDIPEPQQERKKKNGRIEKLCPLCDEDNWVSNRGYKNHIKFTHSEDSTSDSNKDNDSTSNNDDIDKADFKEECPECGSELALSQKIAKGYEKAGHSKVADFLKGKHYICSNCTDKTKVVAFNKSEVVNNG